MDSREKPVDGDLYGWEAFERFADQDDIGLGYVTVDWWDWWICWKRGYMTAKAKSMI